MCVCLDKKAAASICDNRGQHRAAPRQPWGWSCLLRRFLRCRRFVFYWFCQSPSRLLIVVNTAAHITERHLKWGHHAKTLPREPGPWLPPEGHREALPRIRRTQKHQHQGSKSVDECKIHFWICTYCWYLHRDHTGLWRLTTKRTPRTPSRT